MESLATAKLSSKGQVVIPEEIRLRLGLEEGTQFVVVGDRDVVILKTIVPPAMAEFDELIPSSATRMFVGLLSRTPGPPPECETMPNFVANTT